MSEPKMQIKFSPPDISDGEIELVNEVLRSGWLTTGPRTKEFERQIAAYCGVNRAAALNSSTACMEMTLRLLGVGPGDEAITAAYTYTASASVICHVGATLKLVDCQASSLEMDYDKLESMITEKTKVIIPVDLGGVVCDYDRIFEIVERKKHLFRPANAIQEAFGRIIVLADASHSFGATWKGKMSGSIADFSSFSFHAVKNLTTAEGGGITWRPIPGIDDEEIYKTYMLLSLHGQNKDALAKTKLGAWEYDIVAPYYKCNMTDVHAAIGLEQMRRYPRMLDRRHEIWNTYKEGLASLPVHGLNHHPSEDTRSSGHLALIFLDEMSLEQRNDMITRLAEEGVTSNVHYKPLPMHTAYKNLGFDIKDYPNAYAHYAKEITLPLHTCLTNEEVAYIVDRFVKVYQNLSA